MPKHLWANFIDDAAFGHAARRQIEVHRGGGTLEVTRLQRSMLSSMPMCCNHFDSLGQQAEFVDIVREMFDAPAVWIQSVECEHRPAATALKDCTAFDAAIRCIDANGRRVLCRVKIKRTDSFSAKEYDGVDYRHLSDDYGWFLPGAADVLSDPTPASWSVRAGRGVPPLLPRVRDR